MLIGHRLLLVLVLIWRRAYRKTWCVKSSPTRCGLLLSRINSIHAAHTTLVKAPLPGGDWMAEWRLWSVGGIHHPETGRPRWPGQLGVLWALIKTACRACWLCTECRLARTTQALAYNCADLRFRGTAVVPSVRRVQFEDRLLTPLGRRHRRHVWCHCGSQYSLFVLTIGFWTKMVSAVAPNILNVALKLVRRRTSGNNFHRECYICTVLLLYRPKPIHCNYQFVHYSGFSRISPATLNRFEPNLQP